MFFQFDNNTPIYLQLVEQVKIMIISGKLSAGDRLPSVRELALLMKVNPNTVQKALSELEETGLIYTERTNGKFVCDDEELIANFREKHAFSVAEKMLCELEKIGYSTEQTIELISNLERRK